MSFSGESKVGPFFISFALHAWAIALFFILSRSKPFVRPNPSSRPIPVEVVTVDRYKRIVRTNLVSPSNKPAKDAFQSKQTQTVDRQTVSSTGGGEGKGSRTPLNRLGIGLTKPNTTASGAASEHDDSIKQGAETYLNTKESVYYSYFNRIRNQLELAWTRGLRESLLIAYKNGRQLQSATEYKTSVRITLNNLGEITEVKFLEESGVDFVDKTCLDAFNKAGPFPNPPKGLIGNGRVVFYWTFILET